MATRKARAAVETPPPADLPTQETSATAEPVAVRVLVTCYLGRPNDVVSLQEPALAIALAAGLIDPNPEAVAAALR